MHQSRRTHNAHNETQRRLARVAKCSGRYSYPKYDITYFNDDGTINYIEPCWDRRGHIKVHSSDCNFYISKGRIQEAMKRSFYVPYPKSNSLWWRWAKRRLHKIWRTKPLDTLTFTYKDAKGCSLYNLR